MEIVVIYAVCSVYHGMNVETPIENIIKRPCSSGSHRGTQAVQPEPGNVEQIVRSHEPLSGLYHAWYINETMPLVVNIEVTTQVRLEQCCGILQSIVRLLDFHCRKRCDNICDDKLVSLRREDGSRSENSSRPCVHDVAVHG